MITLTNPVTVQQPIAVSSVFISEVFDNPVEKTVKAYVTFGTSGHITRLITVWSGSAYDAIGQWTDTQLNAALKAIIEAPGFTI
jgi:hypothetical protein